VAVEARYLGLELQYVSVTEFDKSKLQDLKNETTDLIVSQRQYDRVPRLSDVQPLMQIYGGEIVTDVDNDNRIPKDMDEIEDFFEQSGLKVVVFRGRNEGTFDRQVVNQLPSVQLMNRGKDGYYCVPVLDE
jgi:hypothetical protein